MMTKNSLENFKLHYEYHENLPEIQKMIRRLKDKARKRPQNKKTTRR